MSIEYLEQLDGTDFETIAKILEPSAESVEQSFQEDHVELRIALQVFEDDEEMISGITDLYIIDDYIVEAYDVALDIDALFEYRRFMFERFGDEYAT